MLTTARPNTTTKKTEVPLLLHVEGRFYLRPLGRRVYGHEASEGLFELTWLDGDVPYPCGRVIGKNDFGCLAVMASNGRAPGLTLDELNDVADKARRKLSSQGW